MLGWQIDNQTKLVSVKAKRLLNTNDVYDYLITANKVLLAWAIGNGTQTKFYKHNLSGQFTVDFSKNDTRLIVTPWNELVY